MESCMKKKIIFVEGSDYVGKTTFIDKFILLLNSEGLKALRIVEPNGEYRKILMSKGNKLSIQGRKFLFAANHIDTMYKIAKEYDNYDYILIDRTALISDFIYNTSDNELNEYLERFAGMYEDLDLTKFNNLFLNNSMTLFLAVTPSIFESRLQARKVKISDYYDSKTEDFKRNICRKYNAMYSYILSEIGDKEDIPSMLDCNYELTSSDKAFIKEHILRKNEKVLSNRYINNKSHANIVFKIFKDEDKDKINKDIIKLYEDIRQGGN